MKKNNRILKFKKVAFKTEKFYPGIIREVEIDDIRQRLRIFVELEKLPEELFMKSLPYSESSYSIMGRFFEEMGAIDENGEVDIDDLEGSAVEVTLNEGKDSNWYVNEMHLIEEFEEYDDEEIFGDGQ
ncbi:hypothetical protein DXA12_15110 [Ruminococcus sp. AM57-5]|nr:hypothetical protein DXA12_15110 [Ruminococcus sp. AM57-5]